MRLLTIFYLILCLGSAKAQVAEIKAAVERAVREQGFSGTVLVADQGRPIYQQSFGLAYRSMPDTIRNHYHYHVASVTKLFTAILVLQLVQEGNLQLTDRAKQYLPDLDVPQAVTIHHLLLHISGLPTTKRKYYRNLHAPADIARKSLQNSSRSKLNTFRYNDLDYVLLGLIIESITGRSWEEQVTACILEPLQMENTGFLEYGYYPDHFAYPYSVSRRGTYEQDPLYYIENLYAAGAMYANARDLLRLDQALYTDQLLDAERRALLAQSNPEYQYAGYGVWNYTYPFSSAKPTVMERRGGIMGANVVLLRLTGANQTIIILSNTDRFNPDSWGDAANLREALIRIVQP